MGGNGCRMKQTSRIYKTERETWEQKNVLVVSSVYVLYFVALIVIGAPCQSEWCDIKEDDLSVQVLYLLLSFSVTFLLSLLTYRMKEEVFRAWWSFARWWVPVIILATLGVNLYIAGEGSGADMFDCGFSAMFLGALYGILILVSLYRIIRTYIALKKG